MIRNGQFHTVSDPLCVYFSQAGSVLEYVLHTSSVSWVFPLYVRSFCLTIAQLWQQLSQANCDLWFAFLRIAKAVEGESGSWATNSSHCLHTLRSLGIALAQPNSSSLAQPSYLWSVILTGFAFLRIAKAEEGKPGFWATNSIQCLHSLRS